MVKTYQRYEQGATKNKSGCFTMQNSRFYRVKPTLLERKTIGFAMR